MDPTKNNTIPEEFSNNHHLLVSEGFQRDPFIPLVHSGNHVGMAHSGRIPKTFMLNVFNAFMNEFSKSHKISLICLSVSPKGVLSNKTFGDYKR